MGRETSYFSRLGDVRYALIGQWGPKADVVVSIRPSESATGAGALFITVVAVAIGNAVFDATARGCAKFRLRANTSRSRWRLADQF